MPNTVRAGVYEEHRKRFNPFRAPKPLPILIPSNLAPKRIFSCGRVQRIGLRYPPHQLLFNEIAGFEPAPGRISWNTLPLATPTSLLDSTTSPLQTRKHEKVDISWHPSSCRAAMKRSIKKIAGFFSGEGGAIVESVKRWMKGEEEEEDARYGIVASGRQSSGK